MVEVHSGHLQGGEASGIQVELETQRDVSQCCRSTRSLRTAGVSYGGVHGGGKTAVIAISPFSMADCAASRNCEESIVCSNLQRCMNKTREDDFVLK